MVNFLTMIGAIGGLAAVLILYGAFGLYGDRAYSLASQVASLGLLLGVGSIACLAGSHGLGLLEQIARNTAPKGEDVTPPAERSS